MHPKEEIFRSVISKYVHGKSVDYAYQLWATNPFHFKVTRTRKAKHGDYQYNSRVKAHMITINGSLNPYLFLITFIHEVAHQRNIIANGMRVAPHGKLWKGIFRSIMGPVMNEQHFPPDILQKLRKHMENPRASSDTDLGLTRVLLGYNKEYRPGVLYLESLKPGERFVFEGKVYKKIAHKRTRALCRETGTGREFLIPELTSIKKVS
jgi:hypothetical protein